MTDVKSTDADADADAGGGEGAEEGIRDTEVSTSPVDLQKARFCVGKLIQQVQARFQAQKLGRQHRLDMSEIVQPSSTKSTRLESPLPVFTSAYARTSLHNLSTDYKPRVLIRNFPHLTMRADDWALGFRVKKAY
ncbi:hypothetical protein BKA65DRAFT_483645 [Rhexocercosporidium sp. MPI-PUGE-AT-0058]|nr:hypothetical protein BKA65DRAFT_483645 [Rhexocercosporidium sp. MPI-PUGE-AT-0058]